MEPMPPKVYKDLIWVDPERLSGTPCFFGTRVPVQHLFDHLEGGVSLQEFCRRFDVEERVAIGVLEVAREELLTFLGGQAA